MKKVQAARQQIAAAIACVMLLFAAAVVDMGYGARADTDEPDYLVLNPKGE